ncbi:MAG TPA: sel1 repeat family protein [Bordetella sp.]|nr:sel1 repeat family protein [Bordetella sp.]
MTRPSCPALPLFPTARAWRRPLAAACLCGLGMLALDARADNPASWLSPGQVYQLALEAQTEADYERMLVLLRQAGNAEHLGAQEMLVHVLLAGPVLYGRHIAADRCEAATWARRSAAQGSAVGRQQWLFLGRARQAPDGHDACK